MTEEQQELIRFLERIKEINDLQLDLFRDLADYIYNKEAS